MISLKELGFFNSGQAELLPGAADKIERIAKILSRQGLEMRVEGHSDNQPIHNGSIPVELGLIDGARDDRPFAPGKRLRLRSDPDISAAGYGQYRPMADDATPEGRRMNRRVDLVVVQANERVVAPVAATPVAKPAETTK